MSEIVYAVHTRACTYLLDEEGICKWVLSRSGQRSDDRCVGAQFVAALDMHSRAGLVGELRIGASALFIRLEGGRFVLIRTKAIEHVEIRGAGAEGSPDEEPEAAAPEHYAYEYPPEPEPEPVVLPSHLAVAGVFEAPAHAPEPSPPSEQRVIVQGWADPQQAWPEAYAPPQHVPLPAPPPRTRAEAARRATPEPPAPAYPVAPSRPAFPSPPPRAQVPVARSSRNDVQETQPLPPLAPSPPAGRVPAWPPMLAPPPPQAEMLPLGPARPDLPSSEELDVNDLEEVGEDEQVYSMEVTLSLPLFRQDPHAAGQAWRR